MTFSEIWNIHKDHLQNFIKTKIDDAYIVDDILQEVSIKLLHSFHKKTIIKNYKTWLFQVTRNTIADYYRKLKKETDLSISTTDTRPASCVCDLSGFIIQTYLPEKYATALYLSDIEKKPQQEIADILNLSLTATKSRIQRARVQLKELVNECVQISYNNKGQITDFHLKNNCELPTELKNEIDRLNLFL
ncbi:sigma factor-like helix-turn-helix DNA-binding protein [Tenacibaculum sp. M341]|uniref:sigma factor-like helix-turn-helix DNA-binding protein n=1 Tax=Tenacibaculum sp. M341 TaxID=2530339 RepID=UPI001049BC3D|nr:sigma factor-like helix-turn-helix DNA-binding protein [Tenacibaculum sp. M341]TCI84537.1 hypothetical protein EYW44_21065 [Tenacibaculum sp. M341]